MRQGRLKLERDDGYEFTPLKFWVRELHSAVGQNTNF